MTNLQDEAITAMTFGRLREVVTLFVSGSPSKLSRIENARCPVRIADELAARVATTVVAGISPYLHEELVSAVAKLRDDGVITPAAERS